MVFVFLGSWTQAQKDYNKVYEKSFSGIKSLEVSHRRGPIEVLPSKNGQVSYKVELTFKANEEADAQGLINHFELNADQLGPCTLCWSVFDKYIGREKQYVRRKYSFGEFSTKG